MDQQVAVFDIVVIVFLSGGLLFGAIRGLIWQLAWLTALVASTLVAMKFGKVVAPLFGTAVPWNLFIAMFVLFVATSFVVWLIFQWLSVFIDRLKLRDFDRQLGAIFGLLKAWALCLVISFFGVTLSQTTRQWVLSSKAGRLLTWTIVSARPLLPSEIHATLKEYLDEFERHLESSKAEDAHQEPGFNSEEKGAVGIFPS